MRNRDDFLKRLHDDEKYKFALSKAKTEQERQKIKQVVEGFVASFADLLGPIIDRAKNDPEFAKQLDQALKERQSVITTEPVISGSTG